MVSTALTSDVLSVSCTVLPARHVSITLQLSLSLLLSLHVIANLMSLLCFRVKDEAAFEEVRGDYNSKNQVKLDEVQLNYG